MVSLFEETEINGMTLSNRFVRSATWDGYAESAGNAVVEGIRMIGRLREMQSK